MSEEKNFCDAALIQLLTTGVFDPVYYGQDLDEIISIFGQPDRIDKEIIKKCLEYITIRYKNLELSFKERKLSMILIEFFIWDPWRSNHVEVFPLFSDWFETIRNMDIDAFITYVKNLSLRVTRLELDGQMECVLWIPDGDLEILFDPDKNYKIRQIVSSLSGPGNRHFVDC